MLRLRVRAIVAVVFLAVSMQAQSKPSVRSSAGEERAERYMDSVRNQPSLLYEFLKEMPKGGDLHNHLTGAVYAESYIQWGAEDGLCVNRATFTYVKPPCDSDKGVVSAKEVLADSALYQQEINALSMRFFVPGAESGHDHFFNTFGKFGAVSRNHFNEEVVEVAQRAAQDNVSYLELMAAMDHGVADRIGKETGWNSNLPELRQKLLANGIAEAVRTARRNLDEADAYRHRVLHCDEQQTPCKVTVRFQYEVHRGLAPEIVFAEMLTGFELASVDPRVVDVNLVMPEDAYVVMHDFHLHMQMMDYLHSVYPKVKISLHAGELWRGVVPEEGLRNHIRESIGLGHASRIGHGVDVLFEDDPFGLMREMAAKKIMVEINVTSNDQILGVRGDEHPLAVYLKYKVPVALSTDDEGVARSDMTLEYLRAVQGSHLTYRQLKMMARNSLEYSFVPGESLWSNVERGKRTNACSVDPAAAQKTSAQCKRFLEHSQKARLQWNLEQSFAQFENARCCEMNR